MATTSGLRAKQTTEALNNAGHGWTVIEAATELILATIASGEAGESTPAPARINVVHKWLNNQARVDIPAGVVSWSIWCSTGSALVITEAAAGSINLQPGTGIRGGGFNPPLATNHVIGIISNAPASTVVVCYETIAP